MQQNRSILACGVIVGLLCLVSLFQLSTETYYYISANVTDEAIDGTAVIAVVFRVIASLLLLASSILFFQHREIGRKGVLVGVYTGFIYLAYVFYEMYATTKSIAFVLIGCGNLLLIVLLIRWLHSKGIRESVQ